MNKIEQCIKKIFRRVDFSGRSVFGRGHKFDWEILLTFFLLVMVVVVSFSIYVFLGVRTGDIFKDDYKAPVRNETINRDVLDRIIKDFDARSTDLKNLQAQKPVFVDPSL